MIRRSAIAALMAGAALIAEASIAGTASTTSERVSRLPLDLDGKWGWK